MVYIGVVIFSARMLFQSSSCASCGSGVKHVNTQLEQFLNEAFKESRQQNSSTGNDGSTLALCRTSGSGWTNCISR